jgi:hypothetical protein
MEKAIFTTIIISSITIFSGCAVDNPKLDNKTKEVSNLDVEKIIGIDTREDYGNIFVVDNEPIKPKYHFIIDRSQNRPLNRDINYNSLQNGINISNNIEVVSYGARANNHIYSNSENIIDVLENRAKSFLGTKYVWGATGPSKFDCSGFTQWVYRDVGINIPRVSRDQARVGEYISFEDLRRGDMVFFDTKKEKKGVVTHVGIYLGNGNFIHASSRAKSVVVYNFRDQPYYKERFLWGRRVINPTDHYASN